MVPNLEFQCSDVTSMMCSKNGSWPPDLWIVIRSGPSVSHWEFVRVRLKNPPRLVVTAQEFAAMATGVVFPCFLIAA
jgi:hypothetical protein